MRLLLMYCFILGLWVSAQAQTKQNPVQMKVFHHAEFWLTDPGTVNRFTNQTPELLFKSNKTPTDSIPTINIDPKSTYQKIDGFGFSLTGGSAIVINRMENRKKEALLANLFKTDSNNIGISYLRVSIGSSDLSDHVFSYDDLAVGQTDTGLFHFDINEDKKDLIPVIKSILVIDPKIQIMASPWSPPLWMKTNHDSKGGTLIRGYYDTYADYFVKYIKAMEAEGISINAITIQNEPLHPGNNPSMYMSAEEQNLFVKTYLGPKFKKNRLRTKIIIYDHNLDRIDYPLTLLEDPGTNPYVDGVAFHLYAGSVEAMSYMHKRFPDKNLYFTEQWINSKDQDLAANLNWHTKNLIVGAMRNWSKNVLEWNLAADIHNGPHTDRSGCDICLGAVTIADNEVYKNPGYYIIAHASKFVRPGSFRIGSNALTQLPNVAFIRPDGKIVLIVLNDTKQEQKFKIKCAEQALYTSLHQGAVGTYVLD